MQEGEIRITRRRKSNAIIMSLLKISTSLIILILIGSCNQLTDSPYLPPDFPIVVKADDTNVPDSLRKLYREDAARLALRKVNEKGETDSVELPHALVQTLYNVFIHVYNLTNLTARDSVVTIYGIHAFLYPETHSLLVAVDSTKDWVQAWRRGERFTGNEAIDKMLRDYELLLGEYYTWPQSHHLAVLWANKPLNIAALAKRFRGIDGVIYAEPNGTCCDGNDIKANAKSFFWELNYSVGYGDCPNGCIARRVWTFNVFQNGMVQYGGSSGAPPPVPGQGG